MPAVSARTLVATPALAICLAGALPAMAVERYPGDAAEVKAMRERSPQAVELLERGEALGAAGELGKAHEAFLAAQAADPGSTLLRRRDCEALTVLGRRGEAVAACSRAYQDARWNVNMRAMVSALVEGPTLPTVSDFLQALAVVSVERHRSPGFAAPLAAACVIAGSIGDGIMLEHCLGQLKKADPNDPEVPVASALLESRCPPARFWTGWLAIAAATLLTMAHALWARVARSRGAAAAAATGGALALLAFLPRTAMAAEGEERPQSGWLSQWPIDKDSPEKSVPSEKERNANPLQFGYWLQDLALKAEHASKKGDHDQAIKLYRAMAVAVPEAAVSYIKLCDEYEAVGDLESARKSCGSALMHDGAKVKDYTRFIYMVLAEPGRIRPLELAAVSKVLEHMKADPEGRAAAEELECDVGERTSNVAQLRECTAALMARAPESPKAVHSKWALAIEEHRFSDARDDIDHAAFLGARVDGMKKATDAREKQWILRLTLMGVSALLFLAAIAFGVRAILQRRRGRPKSGGGIAPGSVVDPGVGGAALDQT
jgi:tetratricopeptide (TPR) repeat protein